MDALDLFFWLLLFTGTWALWLLVYSKGITYEKSPLLTTMFFGISCIAHFVLFPDLLISYLEGREYGLYFLIAFVVLLGLNVVAYSFFQRWYSVVSLQQSAQELKKAYFSLSKQWEIVFQQVSFLTLWLLVQKLYFSNVVLTTLVVTVIFSVLHLPLLVFLRRFFAWYYTVASILGALLFCLLLFYVPNGIVYTLCVHSLFYTGTVWFFWKRQKQFPVIR